MALIDAQNDLPLQEEAARYETELEDAMQCLMVRVFKELGDEEDALNTTSRSLVQDVFIEIEHDERVDQVARSLVQTVHFELDNEFNTHFKIRRSLKKRIAAKRQQKIAEIRFQRKEGRKERTQLTLMDFKIQDLLNDVEKLEYAVEKSEYEVKGMNDVKEDFDMAEELLNQGEENSKLKLNNIRLLSDDIQNQHKEYERRLQISFDKLELSRQKYNKKTKWQKIKAFFTRCVCGMNEENRVDFQREADRCLRDCGPLMFSTPASTRILLRDF